MRLLRLPEKGKRYQSGPTYWKTNFSLSSRKENLSPQEQFALRAEQRLEIAQGNCTAMLSQIREELNTPTDNEQLLRLKRMSKSPHSLSPVSLSVFSLIPDLLFDCSRVLEYAKIRTVLQSSQHIVETKEVHLPLKHLTT